jgi:hypothetical protein
MYCLFLSKHLLRYGNATTGDPASASSAAAPVPAAAAAATAAGETLVRLDCQEPGVSGSQILMVRRFETDSTGYLVENYTSFTLLVRQRLPSESRQEHTLTIGAGGGVSVQAPAPPPGRTLTVAPHHAQPFIWEQPLLPHSVALELRATTDDHPGTAGSASPGPPPPPPSMELSVDFENFREHEPAAVWEEQGVRLLMRVRVRGDTKVLRIAARPLGAASEDLPAAAAAAAAPARDAAEPPSSPTPEQRDGGGGTAEMAETAAAAGAGGGMGSRSFSAAAGGRAGQRARPLAVDMHVVLPECAVCLVERAPGPSDLLALVLRQLRLRATMQVGCPLN